MFLGKNDVSTFIPSYRTACFPLQIEVMEAVRKALVEDRPKSAEECIRWARLLFEENYANQISQLLFNFPADQVTAQGARFWSGSKRCPHPLHFDESNVALMLWFHLI